MIEALTPLDRTSARSRLFCKIAIRSITEPFVENFRITLITASHRIVFVPREIVVHCMGVLRYHGTHIWYEANFMRILELQSIVIANKCTPLCQHISIVM